MYFLLYLAMCLYNIAFLFSFIVTIIFSRLTKCPDIVNNFLCCLNAWQYKMYVFVMPIKLSELN